MNGIQAQKSKGLTLIELIIVMAMIGIMAVVAFGFLNPLKQFDKVQDTQNKSDISQIKTALDVYYNDKSCYPQTLPAGKEWKVGNTVYMSEVPESKGCATDSASCYLYATSGSCPQWNVIFVKLSGASGHREACDLAANCLPRGYSDDWSCTVSGNVDCSILPTFILPSEGEELCIGTEQNYSCTGSPSRCNVVPNGTGRYCSSDCDGAC